MIFHGDKKRLQYETQLNVTSPLMKEAWGLSEHYLDLLIRDAASETVPTVIVGLPARTQVLPHEWESIKKGGFVSDPKLYSDNGSRKQFFKMCKDYQWTCFDVQEELRKADDLDSIFLGGDIHLSSTGNYIVGDAMQFSY